MLFFSFIASKMVDFSGQEDSDSILGNKSSRDWGKISQIVESEPDACPRLSLAMLILKIKMPMFSDDPRS